MGAKTIRVKGTLAANSSTPNYATIFTCPSGKTAKVFLMQGSFISANGNSTAAGQLRLILDAGAQEYLRYLYGDNTNSGDITTSNGGPVANLLGLTVPSSGVNNGTVIGGGEYKLSLRPANAFLGATDLAPAAESLEGASSPASPLITDLNFPIVLESGEALRLGAARTGTKNYTVRYGLIGAVYLDDNA